jgi:hypothetical protein
MLAALNAGCRENPRPIADEPMQLSHEDTLDWIRQNKAWRKARKVKPILARAVEKDEIGKGFQTADGIVEHPKDGYWLCVGIAGEPWFQKKERLDTRFEAGDEEIKQFAFDSRPSKYRIFHPKGDVANWAAQVKGTWHGKEITGFAIRTTYDPDHPLTAPAGGYAVTEDVPDPYRADLKDVWLVQEKLFDSTYEIIPDSAVKP